MVVTHGSGREPTAAMMSGLGNANVSRQSVPLRTSPGSGSFEALGRYLEVCSTASSLVGMQISSLDVQHGRNTSQIYPMQGHTVWKPCIWDGRNRTAWQLETGIE